ncbi:MAG: hemolysin family protein [Bosea sp. (in: a-proteobacteria)]
MNTPAGQASGTTSTKPAQESWLMRLLGRLGLRDTATVREDIADALAQGSQIADLSPQERAMLSNVLKLRELKVADVMIPRVDIISVPADANLGVLLALFRTAGHSRLPVYGETLDDPRGMIHIRDFLDFLAARAESTQKGRRKAVPDAPNLGTVDLSATLASAKILRPVLYAPPSMPAVDLLLRMQATRTHMALIIDEYGGTDGLVSIEDLVEIVVGDIEDEHDLDEGPTIAPAADGRFTASARATLEELRAATGVDLSDAAIAEDVDTLGGLIVTLAGRVPTRGELVKGPDGLEFEVLDADPRRVKRLRVHRRLADDVSQSPPVVAAPVIPAPTGTPTP